MEKYIKKLKTKKEKKKELALKSLLLTGFVLAGMGWYYLIKTFTFYYGNFKGMIFALGWLFLLISSVVITVKIFINKYKFVEVKK